MIKAAAAAAAVLAIGLAVYKAKVMFRYSDADSHIHNAVYEVCYIAEQE